MIILDPSVDSTSLYPALSISKGVGVDEVDPRGTLRNAPVEIRFLDWELPAGILAIFVGPPPIPIGSPPITLITKEEDTDFGGEM